MENIKKMINKYEDYLLEAEVYKKKDEFYNIRASLLEEVIRDLKTIYK